MSLLRIPSAVCMHAVVAWLLACPAGCASFPHSKDSTAVKAETREERKAAVVENFERRRDQTQYQAALSRWNQGDPTGCEKMLEALVARRPDFRDARRFLSDVCLDRNDLPAAESHLRILLEQDPEDSQTHHSLGLLLEETGRREEALHHLDRAVALEPNCELYTLSRDAAHQAQRSTTQMLR